MSSNEPVVSALVSRLTSDLNATIDSINAEAGVVADGYSIHHPSKIYSFLPNLTLLSGTLAVDAPAVAIEDDWTRTEDDAGSFSTGVHQLGVVGFLANPDLEALAWQARRYVRALKSTVLANRSLGSGGGVGQTGAWGVSHVRDDYGPKLQNPNPKHNEQDYLTWVVVTITAHHDE